MVFVPITNLHTHTSVYVYIYTNIIISTYLSISLSIYPSMHPSILSISLMIYQSHHLSIDLSIYLYTYIQFKKVLHQVTTVSRFDLCRILTQVLKTLQSPLPSKPFAINQQYKANMVVNENQDAEADEPSVEPPAKKPRSENVSTGPSTKKRTKTPKSGPLAKPNPGALSSSAAQTYTPNDYSAKRVEFIRKLRDGGMSHHEANNEWNESTLKKELLSTLPVAELVRRRFCPKGTTSNPWA